MKGLNLPRRWYTALHHAAPQAFPCLALRKIPRIFCPHLQPVLSRPVEILRLHFSKVLRGVSRVSKHRQSCRVSAHIFPADLELDSCVLDLVSVCVSCNSTSWRTDCLPWASGHRSPGGNGAGDAPDGTGSDRRRDRRRSSSGMTPQHHPGAAIQRPTTGSHYNTGGVAIAVRQTATSSRLQIPQDLRGCAVAVLVTSPAMPGGRATVASIYPAAGEGDTEPSRNIFAQVGASLAHQRTPIGCGGDFQMTPSRFRQAPGVVSAPPRATARSDAETASRWRSTCSSPPQPS